MSSWARKYFTCKVSVACSFLFRGSVVLIGGLVHLWKIQWSYQGVRAACQSSLRRLKTRDAAFVSDKRARLRFFLSPGNAHQLTSQHIVLCPTTD